MRVTGSSSGKVPTLSADGVFGLNLFRFSKLLGLRIDKGSVLLLFVPSGIFKSPYWFPGLEALPIASGGASLVYAARWQTRFTDFEISSSPIGHLHLLSSSSRMDTISVKSCPSATNRLAAIATSIKLSDGGSLSNRRGRHSLTVIPGREVLLVFEGSSAYGLNGKLGG
jgi:hypothetical protein